MASGFDKQVRLILEKIPRGRVSTYKQIAIATGKPNAARAVGNACNRNPDAPGVPCHRVVCGNAAVGGYARGVGGKIALLRGEGIAVRHGKIVDFEKRIFKF